MNTPQGWHRHENGGGLVEDTATVEATAYVGPNARVSGHARVSGDARVSGYAWEASPPQMVIGRWYGHMQDRSTVAIGCETCDVSDDLHAWVHGLAEKYEATEGEKRAALVFVDWCRAEMEVING